LHHVATLIEIQHDHCVDLVDRAIVEQLRRDARLTNAELAARVGLTPSPCLRRVRRLEESGVITGYHARVDPQATESGFEVIVTATLAGNDLASVEGFEAAVSALPEVVELRRMFGKPDYFLRVAVRDALAYEAFLTTKLMTAPALATFDSHLTMKVLAAAP